MEEKLMHEIEEVQAKIDYLARSPRKQPVSTLFLFTGLFFFIIFLFSFAQKSLLLKAVAVLSFMFFVVSFVRTIADIFLMKKKDYFYYLLAGVLLLLIALSYFAIFEYVLQSYLLIISILLACIVGLITLFYLLHAYLGYIRNMSQKEALITGLIVASSWLSVLIHIIYFNYITFFIFLVDVIIMSKVVLDFSEQFKEKK